MSLPAVSLDDKYTEDGGRIYLTGSQALVRLLLVQRRRDDTAGLNTAGFIAGYRGSPMTAIDVELWRAEQHTAKHQVRFWPATNEHMAATAVWGTQQTHYFGDANYDGVYAMWYGKGPGLDQSLDAIRQGNYHGSAKHGGVLILAGDDPAMRSTVDAYHSELLFEDLLMPVLYPADIQEVFTLGLYGIELSRFSGAWVGYKLLPETIETAATIQADYRYLRIIRPEFEFPSDGVNARAGDSWTLQETRLRAHKLPAAVAFAQANRLNRITHDSPRPRFGIAAMGKTWRDTLQALGDLGLDAPVLSALGIRILKVAMPFPVDRETYRAFAEGLEEVLVIEDKREQIENAIRQICYALPERHRPRIVGRLDEKGRTLVDPIGDLHPDKIARVLAGRIGHFHDSERLRSRIAFLDRQDATQRQREALSLARLPYFCSGCPHNTSTRVPEGSRAYGGVGCHFMANWMDREVYSYSQMGGEGVAWIGQAPFVKTKHIFQQLGDGTYYHSGILAIRSAVAAKINITYKILFNDAVAMTGGQPVDGQLTVPQITHQVRNEGIRRIAVVTDEPEKYGDQSGFATGTTVHHRNALDAVQRELREVEGVSILIYDQTCAAEKRRRRKHGQYPDPAKRLFINDRVCENCGDCGERSNCVSIVPLETEYGRKRQIDQSACNKDYSCNEGFCPSFVTVLGGQLRKTRVPVEAGAGVERTSSGAGDAPKAVPWGARKPKAVALKALGRGNQPPGHGGSGTANSNDASDNTQSTTRRPDVVSRLWEALPEPEQISIPRDGSVAILVGGVGGTGVVTIGAILGMAAHIDGKGASIVDQLGFAQKGGPVATHIRIARKAQHIHSARINAGGADLILGCDLLVAGGDQALAVADREHTRAVVNTQQTITGDFTRDPDLVYPGENLRGRLLGVLGETNVDFIAATQIATRLLGDSIASNMFLVGYAWQRGLLPLSQESIFNAIALNGVSVQWNQQAFEWGRRAAHDLPAVLAVTGKPADTTEPESVEELFNKRATDLAAYQNAAYAQRYVAFVTRVRRIEETHTQGKSSLTEAVARYAYKLMAYKDEYEVARLFADRDFKRKLDERFSGNYKLRFNLSPPAIAPKDKSSGLPRKMEFGGWMLPLFRLLARLRFLRGTTFDPFGHTAERKLERQLIVDYEKTIAELLDGLNDDNHALAVRIASIPNDIRGYGHIKSASVEAARDCQSDLLAQWCAMDAAQIAA